MMKTKLTLILLSLLSSYCINAQQNAIIIGQTFARSAPNYEADNLFSLQDKDFVTILDVSQNKDTPANVTSPCICDSFPWIEVSTSDNRTGWVLGKYVFKILSSYCDIEPVKNMILSIDSIDYHLAALTDFSIGPDDSNGLTGCPGFHPLLLYSNYFEHLALISYGSSWGNSSWDNSIYSEYCNIVSDANRSETITDIEADTITDNLILKISFGTQDGGGTYDVRISINETGLRGDVENWKLNQPENENAEVGDDNK